MKVSKNTIVRTILYILVATNLILTSTGHSPIKYTDSAVTEVVSYTIQLAVLIVGFWKNNSYSKNAIKADDFLNELKKRDNL